MALQEMQKEQISVGTGNQEGVFEIDCAENCGILGER